MNQTINPKPLALFAMIVLKIVSYCPADTTVHV